MSEQKAKTLAQTFTLIKDFDYFNPRIEINVDKEMHPFLMNVHEICDFIKFTPKNIYQVGAANSEEFEFMDFIDRGAKATLFEPHPNFYEELMEKWGCLPNFTIFNLGIYNKVGKFRFVERWASTILEECAAKPGVLDNPITTNDKFFYANCALFSGFDDGNIDLLLLDCQSAEWYCLEKLISRPKVICVETHYIYSQYKNPFIKEIYEWAYSNNYILVAANESDSVFIKN